MSRILIPVRRFHNCRKRFAKASPEIDSIIRVDHAGELGADRIYAGQMAVLGNTKSGPIIREMWEQEKKHKKKFEELIVKHRVRPTVMTPLWNIAGFALGAGTALLGEKAAMACTVAVETVIVEHYNDQLRNLMAHTNPDSELLDTIKQFRDEEQEHHDTGLKEGAEQAPVYQALTSTIKFFCHSAIKISKIHPWSKKNDDRKNQSCSLIICRNYSTTNKKWDLLSAVCVERKPKVLSKLTDFELQYQNVLSDLELINSHKSNHEIRHEEDCVNAQKKTIDVDLDGLVKQTAQDFEDASHAELEEFTKTSFGTEGKTKENEKLQSHLCLLIEQQLSSKPTWMLPQAKLSEGETLRCAAERALINAFGSDLSVKILGNAPFGFYKYKYPKEMRQDHEGAKIFFFKALYQKGSIQINNNEISNYQWATHTELKNIISNSAYLKSIQMFLAT